MLIEYFISPIYEYIIRIKTVLITLFLHLFDFKTKK